MNQKKRMLTAGLAVAMGFTLTACATAEMSTEPAACKVVAAQPGRVNFDASKNSSADNTKARADLAGNAYRLAQLNTPTGSIGTIEQALRDCN